MFAVLALAYLCFVVRLALPARRKQDVEVPPSLRRRSTFDIEPLTAVTAAPSVRTTAMATADSARTTAEQPPAADAGEGREESQQHQAPQAELEAPLFFLFLYH